MNIPTLSLSGRDRYSPEIRDRIFEKLHGAQANETAYQMLLQSGRRDQKRPENRQFDAWLHKRIIQAHDRPVIIQHRR
jgi:hypothetical protein